VVARATCTRTGSGVLGCETRNTTRRTGSHRVLLEGVKLEGVALICGFVSILALADEGLMDLGVLRRRRRRMNARTPIAVNKTARPPTTAPAISPTCDVFDDWDEPVVVGVLLFIGRTGALNKELGQS
jgi:hypothetical protein